MSDLVRVRGLTKHYPGFELAGIDLNVEAGTILGFVGRNGAGKTTTIKSILGLIHPDAGKIELLGECVYPHARLSASLREKIGVVLDSTPFPSDMRLKAVDRIGAANYQSWSSSLFFEYLESFELPQSKKIKDLSRGMGMKLQFAFALAHSPSLLLLDEATAGLDPLARTEATALLREFVSIDEHAALLSTHITSDLDACADTVTCIDSGQIIFTMPKDDITGLAGVAICSRTDFEAIKAAGILSNPATRLSRGSYSTEVLVPDRFAFSAQFPTIPCEPATVEKYMLMNLTGENS